MPDKNKSFMLYPTSYSMIGKEICQLVDAYQKREIDENRLKEVVHTWKQNVPTVLFDPQDQTKLSKGVLRHIGKTRALVINAVLGI